LQREARPRITVERFNPSLYPRRGGRGVSTKSQNEYLADPAIPPKKRRGGQPGNGNAAKPLNALSHRIRRLKKRQACQRKGSVLEITT
jgi:hypothetical protein